MKLFGLVVEIAVITFMLRAFPFMLFSGKNKLPDVMVRLEKQLPQAVMILLVLYCIRSVSFETALGWLPSFAGIVITVLVHLKQKNVLLSIFSGTLCYMVLIRMNI